MTAGIEWTAPAFARLESLPEALAFEVTGHVDALAAFPEMGLPIRVRTPRCGSAGS